MTDTATLAKAIFDWLLDNAGDPYTYNSDAGHLTIDVDGGLDCMEMAEGIMQIINRNEPT